MDAGTGPPPEEPEKSAGGTPPAGNDPQAGSRITRSAHAKLRSRQGRAIGTVVNDTQRAAETDVYVQLDGRYIVRGPKGREHVIDPNGEHVTTVHRSRAAHQQKVQNAERRPAKRAEYDALKRFVE